MMRHLLIALSSLVTLAGFVLATAAAFAGVWVVTAVASALTVFAARTTSQARALLPTAPAPAPAPAQASARPRMPLAWRHDRLACRYERLAEQYYVHADPLGPAGVLLAAVGAAATAIVLISIDSAVR